jgi:hypothetical protein
MVPALFHKRKTLDRYDAKFGAALAHLGRFTIFWRVIPASRGIHVWKFEYRHTTRRRPLAFEQRVLLAAGKISARMSTSAGVRGR